MVAKLRAILWAIFFYVFGVITTIFGVALQGPSGMDSCRSDVPVLLSTLRQIQSIGDSGSIASTATESAAAPSANNETTSIGILDDKNAKVTENLFISQGTIQVKPKTPKAAVYTEDNSKVLTDDDGLKVLAFSIFGKDERYLKPMLHNAQVV